MAYPNYVPEPTYAPYRVVETFQNTNVSADVRVGAALPPAVYQVIVGHVTTYDAPEFNISTMDCPDVNESVKVVAPARVFV